MSMRKLRARGIGRLELLSWLNELLETDYTKIEHLADGVAYCQALDAIHPGKVKLQQVEFQTRSVSAYERNFIVLRRALHSCNIRKELDIRKLVEGVFQEHFELLHWFHDYAQTAYPDAVKQYNGLARRQQVLGQSTLSLTELSTINTNLIPSYSSSSKARNTLLFSELDMDTSDVDESVSSALTLEDVEAFDTSVDEHKETPVIAQAEEQSTSDPLLVHVQDSYIHTLEAKKVIDQVQSAIELVCDEPEVKTPKSTRNHNKSKSSGRQVVKDKSKDKTAMDSDPPFLLPQLHALIDILSDELLGRSKDLNELERTIKELREQS